MIANRDELAVMLKGVCEYFHEVYNDPSSSTDSAFVPSIKAKIDRFEGMLESKQKELSDLEEEMSGLKEKKASLDARIPKVEELARTIVKDTVPEVFTKISEFIADCNHVIDEQQHLLD